MTPRASSEARGREEASYCLERSERGPEVASSEARVEQRLLRVKREWSRGCLEQSERGPETASSEGVERSKITGSESGTEIASSEAKSNRSKRWTGPYCRASITEAQIEGGADHVSRSHVNSSQTATHIDTYIILHLPYLVSVACLHPSNPSKSRSKWQKASTECSSVALKVAQKLWVRASEIPMT